MQLIKKLDYITLIIITEIVIDTKFHRSKNDLIEYCKKFNIKLKQIDNAGRAKRKLPRRSLIR